MHQSLKSSVEFVVSPQAYKASPSDHNTYLTSLSLFTFQPLYKLGTNIHLAGAIRRTPIDAPAPSRQ
jgi:hypothetical protein